jgi:ABC-type Fe3+ transport system permease subunit
VKARVFVAVGVLAFVLAVVLGMNHVESCKLSSPPQCVTEGPGWALIGSTFALSAAAFVAAAIVGAKNRRVAKLGNLRSDRPETR